MTAYSKEGESLLKKYEREDSLMFPLHKSDTENPVRKAFVQELMNNENFRKTNQANEPRLEETFKAAIRKFGVKDYIVVAIVTAMYGTIGCVVANAYLPKSENQTKEAKQPIDYAKEAVLITLVLLASFAASMGTVGAVKQSSTELAYDRTFSRIAVRLFDDRKKRHPELDEEILKLCNPELGRVIKALLVANMLDVDIRKIRHVARAINSDNSAEVNDNLFEEAMKVVKGLLIANPWLKQTVTEVYKGKIPAVFTVALQSEKQRA